MKVRKASASRKQKDVLENLGRIIHDKVKKGVRRVEEIFKDRPEQADDKIFSYLKVFMDDKGVASITPSSRFLVERVVKAMDLRQARLVIEYGAANGVMTRSILEKLSPAGRLFSIELNDRLYKHLSSIPDPRLICYHGDVREIASIAKRLSLLEADVIVSGIPFSLLSRRARHEILLKTSELLRPGGRFVAYQITTHLIPILKDYFKRVKTEFEIRNIPPNFVFTAFK
jgi:phospholipid N-methyltransferase